MNNVEVGNVAEARFVSDAIAQGFSPAVPWGGQKGYDVVLTSGTRHFRVQVKSCSSQRRRFANSTPRYHVELRDGNSHGPDRKRRSGTYDVLAVWLSLDSRWVFVSRANSRGKNGLVLRPGVGLAKHTDNWEIFRR